MKPLRLLLISDFPYKGVVRGGVESAVEILATVLSKSKEVEAVLVVNFRMDREVDEIVNMSDTLTVHYVAGQRRLALPTFSILDVLKAKQIATKFRPDIVHGQGTDTHGDVATRLGYPSVVTIHGVGSFEAELREKGKPIIGPLRVRLTKNMVTRILRRAKVVISISEFDRQYCLRFRQEGLVHIPNAVRPEFLETEPVFSDANHVLFTGLIIERKNVVGLVRAFHKVKQLVPDAVLDIAGPAPDKTYYERVIDVIDPDVKKDVIFHGNLKGQALAHLMSFAAVAVLFSIYENLPVAIAEALAVGKPVVASRVGAVAEMVTDGVNGFLVESEDEETIADRLIRLLKDPQLRREFGTKGREMAMQNWNPERVAEQTLRAYRSALHNQ